MFHTLFHHEPAHQIIICKEHQTAIPFRELPTHLTRFHQHYTPAQRKQIQEEALSIRPWFQTAREVVLPGNPGDQLLPEALPYLPVYDNGIQCLQCGDVFTPLTAMHTHLRKKHNWVNPVQRGRPVRGQQRSRQPWREGVSCQKYQPTGRLGTRFAVKARLPVLPTQPSLLPSHEVDPSIATVLDSMASTIAADQGAESLTIREQENHYQPNAWLERTGWVKHLVGFDRQWLASLVVPDPSDPPEMQLFLKITRRVMWKAQRICQQGVVGQSALFYANRRETGTDSNERPLTCTQTGATMDKYFQHWAGILRFLWRTHQLPVITVTDQERGSATGVRPSYRLTHSQLDTLGNITRIVETLCAEDAQVVEEDREQDSNNEDADEDNNNNNSDDDDDDDNNDEEDDSIGEEQGREGLQAEDEDEGDSTVVLVLEGHVVTLLIALLDQNVGDNEYSSPLLSAMAVLGINQKTGWADAAGYTPKQSAVITISKMIVVYQAYLRRKKLVSSLYSEGIIEEVVETEVPSHFELVRELTDRFMILTPLGGDPTPVDFILRLRTYGISIQRNTNTTGTGEWIGDQVSVYGKTMIAIPDLQSMVSSLIEDAKALLQEKLLLLPITCRGETPTSLPKIPWDQLVDDPSNNEVGHYFGLDARNEGIIEGIPRPHQWLWHRLGHTPTLQQQFLQLGPEGHLPTIQDGRTHEDILRVSAFYDYKATLAEFKAMLLVLVHITGGPPPRGTELLTTQYANTFDGEGRGVYIENGLVACVTRYHKGYSQTKTAKVTHRYLPPEVGELMVYLIWFILPFANGMEYWLNRDSQRYIRENRFLWPPRPETRWTKPTIRIHTPYKRQRAIREERSPPPTFTQIVGEAVWTSQKVSSTLNQFFKRYTGRGAGLAPYRQITVMIYRKKTLYPETSHVFEDTERSEDEVPDHAYDLMMNHGSRQADMGYGRGAADAAFSTEAKRYELRKVSLEWHRILHLPSAIQAQAALQRLPGPTRNAAVLHSFRRLRAFQQKDLNQALVTMTRNPCAQFKPKQAKGLTYIQQGANAMVVIMPTGGGKSLLFMLPAWCSKGGTTIVVVPLDTLRSNMVSRCRALGMTAIAWDSRYPNRSAQLVFVTPEAASMPSFRGYLHHLAASGLLDRVVVDEAHVVFDSVNGWRRAFLSIYNLFFAEVPVIFLTATLPPTQAELFTQLYKLPNNAVWLRVSTVRPNHAYQVRPYLATDQTATVRRLASTLRARYLGKGQILIYCATIALTKEVAEIVGCPAYYRDVGTAEEKTSLASHLLKGQEPVFVATNAWGLGLDAPSIRAVVWVGQVRNILAVAQEAGRGGRDGKRTEIILLQSCQRVAPGSSKLRPLYLTEADAHLREIVSGQKCVRQVLDLHLDGDSLRERCAATEEACFFCIRRYLGYTKNLYEDWLGDKEEEFFENGGDTGSEDEGSLSDLPATAEPTQEQLQKEKEREEEEAFRHYHEQIAQRRQNARAITTSLQAEQSAIQYTLRLLRKWKQGCMLCLAFGFPSAADGHRLEQCTNQRAHQVRLDIATFQKGPGRRVASYAACFYCGFPQSVCEAWEQQDNGGYMKVSGRRCQFQHIGYALFTLLRAVAAQDKNLRGYSLVGCVEAWCNESLSKHKDALEWFIKKRVWNELEGNNGFYILVIAVSKWLEGSVAGEGL